MGRNYFAAVILGALLSAAAVAQDAKTVIDSAAKTMGVLNLGSVRYTGSGLNFALGQAPNPSSPWPKFNVKTYERVIDFDAGATSQTMVRTQGENPPHGGGLQPIVGEQTQTQINGFAQPWASKFEAWVTPVGFLKGALASGNATLQAKTAGGKKYNVVSYMVDGKYKVNGYIDDRNLVDKVETWVENPVLGDMPVEATYSDYKEFHGLKFPSKIVETQGGYPVMDLTITDANRNVVAGVQPPGKDAAPQNPIFGVDETLIADDVYYFTGGTHHSVIVNFNDYVVVIEGPLDEARSSAVIGEVKKLYFNKPIRYLVNTHAHFDHAGGIRTYAAEGATILTYQMNKPYYEKTFAMPRTLAPDKLLQSKKKAVIEAVGEKRVLSDGTHTIELYHVPNQHNEGMLIAYLPKEKIVVEADLYTPGAPGAPTPNPVSPYTVSLLENLDRLKLDYDKILGLHGRLATKDELLKAAGRAASKPASK
jgi:glyoxylase-like metal-dependent hydrolase (beta-lactamase superfamily II)